mmetsp:Transcript_34855/g.76860  ORF Transcript_34855/g.76860 Transcript_34855/m.76860 type:complete len:239 (-) Transcript_34855:27-743(-)
MDFEPLRLPGVTFPPRGESPGEGPPCPPEWGLFDGVWAVEPPPLYLDAPGVCIALGVLPAGEGIPLAALFTAGELTPLLPGPLLPLIMLLFVLFGVLLLLLPFPLPLGLGRAPEAPELRRPEGSPPCWLGPCPGDESWCGFETWKWDLWSPPWSSGGAELVLVGMYDGLLPGLWFPGPGLTLLPASAGIICTVLLPGISRFPELPGLPFLLFPIDGDAVAGPASEALPLSSFPCFDIE